VWTNGHTREYTDVQGTSGDIGLYLNEQSFHSLSDLQLIFYFCVGNIRDKLEAHREKYLMWLTFLESGRLVIVENTQGSPDRVAHSLPGLGVSYREGPGVTISIEEVFSKEYISAKLVNV